MKKPPSTDELRQTVISGASELQSAPAKKNGSLIVPGTIANQIAALLAAQAGKMPLPKGNMGHEIAMAAAGAMAKAAQMAMEHRARLAQAIECMAEDPRINTPLREVLAETALKEGGRITGKAGRIVSVAESVAIASPRHPFGQIKRDDVGRLQEAAERGIFHLGNEISLTAEPQLSPLPFRDVSDLLSQPGTTEETSAILSNLMETAYENASALIDGSSLITLREWRRVAEKLTMLQKRIEAMGPHPDIMKAAEAVRFQHFMAIALLLLRIREDAIKRIEPLMNTMLQPSA